MAGEISSFGSSPYIGALPAGVPERVADTLRANAGAEDRLVADALRQLGQEVPPRRHLLTADPERIAAAGERLVSWPDRRHAYVPVGTNVATGASHEDQWVVVGASGNDLHLAQRTADGTGVRQVKRGWNELVPYSTSLFDRPIHAHGEEWMPYTSDGVELHGRDGTVELVNEAAMREAAATESPPRTVRASWGFVVDAIGLDQRIPGVDMPQSEFDAMYVRDMVGDRHFVHSELGEQYGIRSALIGTDAAQGRAGDVLADAAELQQWFHDKAGIDVWAPHQEAIIRTDKHAYLSNAAANAIGGDAYLYEGPRDELIRDRWLHELSGDYGRAVRATNEVIREYDDAVRAHEAGHVAIRREWGANFDRIRVGTDMRLVLEDGIVEEALADLFGAAHDGRDSVGVRDLGRLRADWGTLDHLHRMFDATPLDKLGPHDGTQLITKPMLELQRLHGDDALAEVTGAAVRDLGLQIREHGLTTVDIPTAARALRDATAWRHGADSAVVQHLDTAWKALRVFT